MVKLYKILLAISFVGFLGCFFEQGVYANPADFKVILEKKIIVALPNFDEPLFFYRDRENRLQGFEVDLARNMADALGVKLIFSREAKNYDEIVQIISQNKADMDAGGLSKTLVRAQKVLFSQTYLTLYESVIFDRAWMAEELSKHRFKNWHKIDILNQGSYLLGVISGTSYVEFAQKMFPQKNIEYLPSWDAALQALAEKKIQVIFFDDFTIKYFFLTHPDMALKYESIVFKNHPDEIAFAVSFKDLPLLAWINLYLHLNSVSYDADKILRDYWKQYHSQSLSN